MKKQPGIDNFAAIVYEKLLAWTQAKGITMDSIFTGNLSKYQQLKNRVAIVRQVLEEGMTNRLTKEIQKLHYYDEVNEIILKLADAESKFRPLFVGKEQGSERISQLYKQYAG
ncbi:hypothetical protein SAMN05421788_10587 [Filimonas lacunae]|uniref:Uncharacterized protein n=1 Tax=Filimonas lacunae TaxID=477680 RepID=A0A173MDD8_9BACT|nr:hypothetical protein [Filimonas lacunae]BAV05461.1 hypothetical protein FLA_1468 [Filimonas lacunae]SIT20993.1 hypothetical protein SAMN05421788_10587 [Filimonas lacunae]